MNKFVVVLNKAYDIGQLVSGLGHVTAGIAGNTASREEMQFVSYVDKTGDIYPNISECSFIVLRGSGSHIKRFRTDLIGSKIPYASYLDTMLSGGSTAQQAATLEKSRDEVEILALATFGESTILDPMTKRFSLWRM